VLRVRHAITNTNYYVRIYAPKGPTDRSLRQAIPLAKSDLHWVKTATLGRLALTGLTRKVLRRLDVMAVQPLREPAREPEAAIKSPAQRIKKEIVDHDEDHDSF